MIRILALLALLLPTSAAAVDYQIDNLPGATFRAELNDHLEAIVQQNAGTVAPSVTFPYMVWADTSGAAPILQYRNAANSGWAAAFRIDPSSTMWLGGITTSSATITGGSINGTAIGATTPAAGTFTTVSSTFQQMTGDANEIRMRASNTASTHNQLSIVNNAGEHTFRTLSSSGAIVSNDYVMSKGATGVTTHSWRVQNSEVLQLSGVTLRTRGLRPFEAGWNIGADAVGANIVRYGTIYLQFAPNVSSDARLKNSIEDVAAAECRVADRIEIRRYRMNSEPDGPWHFGSIAQEVIAAFEAEGLDWQDYAIVTGSEADTYGVAYDELQNLKLACM